jgi:hypothetical protein
VIVHTPNIAVQNGQVEISARFELRSPLAALPKYLWYRFPEQYASNLSPRADGFAATGLLLAMYTGEKLTIRGPISSRLAYGLFEYRNILHGWLPRLFRMVDIDYDEIENLSPGGTSGAVATAFSGGADSFFTLWSHLAENQIIPQARVTHGLFIHGYDLSLDADDTFQAITKKYSALFNALGLDLILASTNAYQFAEFRIDWSLFFGPPLIGAAQLLSPYLRRFYVPSGFPYHELIPEGSTALTDHLLSTESLDVVHHGASTSRFEKLSVLGKWPVTYDHLRVCARRRQPIQIRNCSACHKCYRTMTALSILGVLDRYTTFSANLSWRDYFRWGLQTHNNLIFARDLRRRAWASGKIKLAAGTQVVISVNSIVKVVLGLLGSLFSTEQRHRMKRFLLKPDMQEPRP